MVDEDTLWWLRNAALNPSDILDDGKPCVFVRAQVLNELLDLIETKAIWREMWQAREDVLEEFKKIPKEEKKVSEKASKQCAFYAYRVMTRYINDIRDASYPQTAEETGGYAYTYFLEHLKNLEFIINGGDPKDLLNRELKKDD